MNQGWHGDDYLALFSAEEAETASAQYGLERWLPGFSLVGLRSWDDLIVRDPSGTTFSVAAVPVLHSGLEPYELPVAGVTLSPDDRFTDRIKWYVKPLVFGGSAEAPDNLAWVSPPEHAQLVVWWNSLFRDLQSGQDVVV